jgi:hypothetical protein
VSADLLREAAAAIRNDWTSHVWDLAVADLLDALALDREMDPYLPKPFDEAAISTARAYLNAIPTP